MRKLFLLADLCSTLARVARAHVPEDRPIDSVDQLDFFVDRQEKSNRDGLAFYIEDELRAVRWRSSKMHLICEPEPNAGPAKLESPNLFNLIYGSKEKATCRRPVTGCVVRCAA
jgi:arylsulfatase